MPKPVVAAVNGAAAGWAARSRWPAIWSSPRESAYLLLAFVNIGLMPDGGSTLLIPTRVGFARAAEMALLGERVPAAKALEWGLINRVHPDEEFEGEVRELALRLAAGPTLSYAARRSR